MVVSAASSAAERGPPGLSPLLRAANRRNSASESCSRCRAPQTAGHTLDKRWSKTGQTLVKEARRRLRVVQPLRRGGVARVRDDHWSKTGQNTSRTPVAGRHTWGVTYCDL